MHNGVQFDEQNTEQYRLSRNVDTQKSAMVRLFVSLGVPEKYVNYAMILIAIIFFAISIFIFIRPPGSVGSTNQNNIPGTVKNP